MKRPDDFSSSTLFEDLREVVLAPDALQPGPLPICGNGALLRAVLLVQLCLAVPLALFVPGWRVWVMWQAQLSVVALPATLAWLVVMCLASRPLGRQAPLLQVALAGGLGALISLGLCHLTFRFGVLPAPAQPWLAPAAVGWLLATLLYQLERGRQRARLPVAAAARLADLQTRIRPHFLFNTLNTAISLVQTDPLRAEEVLENLSDLFRAGLGGLDEIKTVEEELTLGRRYLAIEELRFGERLQVRWDLDPAADQAWLPPLALQPLIENAVRHGVEPSDRGGRIEIRTRRRRDRVLIAITNSLPEPTAARAHRGHGIGVASVRERLRLMYDLDADFHSGRIEDGRWRVSISLPANGRPQ